MVLPALLDGASRRRIAAKKRSRPPGRVHRSVGCGLAPAGTRVLRAKEGTGPHAFLMFPTAANFGGLFTRESWKNSPPTPPGNKGKKNDHVLVQAPILVWDTRSQVV